MLAELRNTKLCFSEGDMLIKRFGLFDIVIIVILLYFKTTFIGYFVIS